MFYRTMCLLLISASQAVAQTESFTENESPSAPIDSQTPAATSGEPYTFEIRFISVPEEAILPLRKLKNYRMQSIEPRPFATSSQLDADSPIRIQKIETQVISAPRMSVAEVSDKQAIELIQRAQDDSRSNIMFAPSIKARLGEVAVISDNDVSLSAEDKAPSGVQIHLRTNSLENGMIQADTEIMFRGRVSDDFDRFEQTTISFSGILRNERLTLVVVPEPLPESEPAPKSPIQRVSNVVRLRKAKPAEPKQLLTMITVVAPKVAPSQR